VTVVYGSLDQLASQLEIEETFPLLPLDTVKVLIEGGNHAQFGQYGIQNGDGIATMEPEEQQIIVIEAILNTLRSCS